MPRSRGDRLALARLLTAVENRTPVAEAAMRRLYPLAGRAHLVGITGPPGAGKSTLVAAPHRRGPARPDGPSASSRSTRRARSPAARCSAIASGCRPTPTTATCSSARWRRAATPAGSPRRRARRRPSSTPAGFDLILIETVGTGQSEVEVAAAADTTVVLEAPEMGDEVQAIKAGLLEVADLVVVNKGDKPGAQRTAAQLRAMLVPTTGGAAGRTADATRPRPKRPEVLITTAATGDGVPELLAALDRHRAAGRAGAAAGRAPRPRRGPGLGDPRRAAAGRLLDADTATRHGAVLAEVADHRLDPYAAADRLLAMSDEHERARPGRRRPAPRRRGS